MNSTCQQVISRYSGNPVLSAEDIPYDATLVFNAGVTRYQGKFVMVFRNDWGDFHYKGGEQGTNLGVAFSDDGISWDVKPKPCWSINDKEVKRVYDPRLTVIDGKCYICFAMDTCHGIRGGVGVTEDFENFEILSLSAPDNRNMVLFPEKVGGSYIRLERPFPLYCTPAGAEPQFDIWVSSSPDLKHWGGTELLLGAENVPYANGKIGPGAPPIKTDKGWLTLFHAVRRVDRNLGGWEPYPWNREYLIGVMLLDSENPGKILGMYDKPLLEPSEEFKYEVDGFRNNVLFPTGLVDMGDGSVNIYYGAADTVMSLATAGIDDLIKLCLEGN